MRDWKCTAGPENAYMDILAIGRNLPCDHDPLTLDTCNVGHIGCDAQTLYQILAKSNNPRLNFSDLKIEN